MQCHYRGDILLALTLHSRPTRRDYEYQRLDGTELSELPAFHRDHDPKEITNEQSQPAEFSPRSSSEEEDRLPEDESSRPLVAKEEDEDLENGPPEEESFSQNPFKPLSGLPEERPNALTARALIIGLIAGTLVNASNVYLGLKSGWTFTAGLFGVSSNAV